MKDGYGREIDYLRVSLTDKCNLRCAYCMPETGIKQLEHKDILTLEETLRLVSIMTGLGIRRVRITGGEPLVRHGGVDFVEMLGRSGGLYEIAMTTNGSLLGRYAKTLKEAGLSSVNISLDTLDREIFMRLTHRDELPQVLEGIEEAGQAGLAVKLNCVPIRGVNEDDIIPLTAFASDKGYTIRFIELMPIGCGAGFEGVSPDEILKRLEERYGTAEHITNPEELRISGPAVYYRFPLYRGRVGFISPVSHRFCDHCDRIRLTAEGFLKLCLQYPAGVDLRTPLRNGASDEELRRMIAGSLQDKPASHSFGSMKGAFDVRKMVQIGG